ncbi:MAG TPA: DUF2207 domain-containing protein [Actinomycetota bacterium]|nr:DUF2207 domain-containing protein [Actinomycetota bacterium]
MRRSIGFVWIGLLAAVVLLSAAPTAAQGFESERTERFDVDITIEPSGDLLIRETILQQFGSMPRHGIFRYIPNRLRYDDQYDRVYPIEVVSVTTSPRTPDGVETSEENGNFVIRIGDPDVEVSGRHTYEIVYRVEGAMNGFQTHDELYWNAIGDRWEQSISEMTVRVRASAPVDRVACSSGPFGSTFQCGSANIKNGVARFAHQGLPAYTALSVVVALPPGTVASTAPILDERWSLDRAFARTRVTVGGGLGLLVFVIGGFAWLAWRAGRDVRYSGSRIDQVMGAPEGGPIQAETQAVPLLEKGTAPVEYAPPEDLRPGQIGTLIDEEANTLDVTATIVDLAVRGYLVIEEIPKEGWFGKPDWKLTRQPKETEELLDYERTLLEGLFEDGPETLLSDLKKTFVARLQEVKDALYGDMVSRKWFVKRPDKVRAMWTGIGIAALLLGIGATVALAYFTNLGLLGLPLIAGGILLMIGAKRMPRRTAKGTAMTRRVNGFRVVIEKVEQHTSHWAEEEKVFTRFLPFAVVFGVTEKWAKAFEALGQVPADDMGWYRSAHPFTYAAFADSMDAFSVTTSGTIASTPSGSGGSGFGGGGFSGGGGGGGGGGSW